MTTYLVGWDGSEGSDRALEMTASLAGQGDTIVAVSVVPARLQDRSFLEMLLPTIDISNVVQPDSFTERAAARLTERVDQLDTKAQVRVEVRAGDPADEILKIIEDDGIDHVIVGYKSYERHLRFEIGSNAEKVVRHAPCPVTVVRWPDAPDR